MTLYNYFRVKSKTIISQYDILSSSNRPKCYNHSNLLYQEGSMKLLYLFICIGTIAVVWIGFHEQFTAYLVSLIVISTLVLALPICLKMYARNSKAMRRSNIRIQLLED